MGSQAALSSPSTPLNVEFSAKPGNKETREESLAPPPESIPALDAELAETQDLPPVPRTGPLDGSEEPTRDPISISKSLRRVRASGSLIIETSKKKQEEMNKIIAQAIEGADSKSRQPALPPVAKTPPKPQPPAQPGPRPAGHRPPTQPRMGALGSMAGSVPPMSRRPSGALSGPMITQGIGLSSNGGQLSPNGPSSVLAQASGLNPQPGYGSKFRVGLFVLALLLGIGFYLLFRERMIGAPKLANLERDLKRVEDQSEQYVRLGERDREQGQYESALGNFQQALLLTPNNPNVHFLMAQTYYNAGLTDEALKAYKALLRIAPEHLEARLQVAQIHQVRGNWNAAYQEYQRIIALDQNSSQAATALERIEANQANQAVGFPAPFPIARRARVVSKSYRPELPPAIPLQAQIPGPPLGVATTPPIRPPVAVNNRPDENPDPVSMAEIRKKLGLRYLNVREYRAAINDFLAALRLTPDDKDIYYFLGSAYFGLGQFALAHDYYKRVDKGQYVQVAQSGAQRTEKAAREELKRRMEMIKNDVKNEAKKEADDNSPLDKPIMNNLR
ncbi:MAG TPA: tetratricopeptide repeat protein [Blastocatellia bacterium]|nr:tetratricopeptide repeat protein [Blastocatellia bacterium]